MKKQMNKLSFFNGWNRKQQKRDREELFINQDLNNLTILSKTNSSNFEEIET